LRNSNLTENGSKESKFAQKFAQKLNNCTFTFVTFEILFEEQFVLQVQWSVQSTDMDKRTEWPCLARRKVFRT